MPRNSSKLKKIVACLEVGTSVCLRLFGEGPVGGPKIDQRLHWLQLMRLQHVNLGSSKDEVTEAAVHALFEIEMIEGFNEVGPVEVSVNTEHLTEDGLADVVELAREAAAFSNPVTGASKLRKRCIQVGRSSGDWSIGSWSVETA